MNRNPEAYPAGVIITLIRAASRSDFLQDLITRRCGLTKPVPRPVPILTETTVLRLDAQKPAVQTTSPTGLEEYGARAVLLATGAREAHRHARLVAGDRARGVYTTASLFQSLYGNGHLPERRFVVFGSEDVSYSCVNAIRSQRRTVVAVVETAPATRSFGWLRWFVETCKVSRISFPFRSSPCTGGLA